MQFDHLKLTGFKSFVDPTELDISNGLTGVVGPNGCGKSNLVEALRWVMGETSAKQMRGGEMDDVIFNGAMNRPARNIAEVTLVVDNSDRKAPAALNDSEELSVARRIERTKGSNYRVNGRDVRSRDVQLLFADAGTGARSAGIVNQGRVGALINAKPSERRILLEEAANIRGLYTRRHEAELRLKGAETNLERLEDILNSVQGQLRGLNHQAKQARRYRTINEQIRQSESILLHVRWTAVKLEQKAASLSLHEADQGVQGATEAAAKASRIRVEAAEKMPQLRQQEAENAASLQRLNLSLNELRNELVRIDAARSECTDRLDQISNDIEREQALANEAAVAVGELNKELSDIKIDMAGEGERKGVAMAALENINKQTHELETQVSQIMESIASNEARRSSLDQQVRIAIEREERLNRQLEDVEAELNQTDAVNSLKLSMETLENSVQQASEIAVKVTNDLETTGKKKVDHERRVEEAHQTLREISANVVGLNTEAESIRSLLSEKTTDGIEPILDNVNVEQGYEDALAAALGDDLTAPVETKTGGLLPRFWLKILSVGTAPKLPNGVPSLAEWVSAPIELERRLKQIGVVDSEQTAMKLQSSLLQGQCLTSIKGGLWRWDGFVSRNEITSQSSIRIDQNRRLRELSVELERAIELKKRAEKALELETTKLDELDAIEKEARKNYKDAFEKLDNARQNLLDIKHSDTELSNKLIRLTETRVQLVEDINDSCRQQEMAKNDIESLEDLQLLQSKSQKARDELLGCRENQAVARSHYDEMNRESKSRQIRLSVIRNDLETWLERTKKAELRMSDLESRKNTGVAELKRLDERPEEVRNQQKQLQISTEKMEKERKEAADNLAVAETALLEADKHAREMDLDLGSKREERIRAEATLEQVNYSITTLEERILERLGYSPEEILLKSGIESDSAIADVDSIEAKIERLGRERERIGPVNLRAEIEVQELQEKISSMERERDDLNGAIDRLRRAISSLNREGRERILEAFDAVNKHFQELFIRLFGGGSAHLTLVEAEDPLEAGIEIMTSPPGKKLQVMSLLSGGEQALTALALVFAAFLTNPAPICVLDEVDAPLDDSNVDRFCSLLTDLSKTTQTRFLIITHHRLTMARMDRLFGVTMAEQGVSQLVSVNLEGAEELRESG
ncbi:MAG: hypothetical protein CMM58_10265 [Rhodospirillaceae bacterium]|nr:hypothetical protein [Rhodospirillaceae bacterium]